MILATETVFGGSSFTYLSFFLSSFLIVGILFIVYLLVRKYVRRTNGRTVEIIDRVVLDRNNSIYLLKLPNKYIYISSGPNGVTILGEVDELEVAERLPVSHRGLKGFKDIFFKRVGKFSLNEEIDKLEKLEK